MFTLSYVCLWANPQCNLLYLFLTDSSRLKLEHGDWWISSSFSCSTSLQQSALDQNVSWKRTNKLYKEIQVIRHCSSMSFHVQPHAFPPRCWQLVQRRSRHSSNFLTLLKMWSKEFPHLFFDCSPTASLSCWPGDLFLCVIHKQAWRNCEGRYAYLTFQPQTFLSTTLKEFVKLFC